MSYYDFQKIQMVYPSLFLYHNLPSLLPLTSILEKHDRLVYSSFKIYKKIITSIQVIINLPANIQKHVCWANA